LQTSRVENATPVVVTGPHVWSNPMRACWGPEEGEGEKQALGVMILIIDMRNSEAKS
jgi:hypothetical protein